MHIKNLVTLVGLLLVGLLPACGGGADTGNTGLVRLVNATRSVAALDLRVSGANLITGVAAGTTSGYVEREAGTAAFQLGATGSTTTILTRNASVGEDASYTFVAYVTDNALHAVFFDDAEDAPSSNTAKFRVYNGSNEAGSLDVYLTDAADTANDLSSATPVNAAVDGEKFGAYGEIGAGRYRLRVTAADDRTDVRLDIASITLTDQQVATLVVTSSDGGVLVDGLLLNQAGSAAALPNGSMRLRVAADTTLNAKVTLARGTTNLASLNSPSIGNYVTVPGDLAGLTLKVDGVGLALPATDASPGSDLTLLVYGDAAHPQAVFLPDDNRLPTSSGRSTVRLVHGINGSTGTLSLDVDFSAAAAGVALGAASPYATVTAGTGMRFDVRADGVRLSGGEDVDMVANAVYTLFMLGDTTTPVFLLRRDR